MQFDMHLRKNLRNIFSFAIKMLKIESMAYVCYALPSSLSTSLHFFVHNLDLFHMCAVQLAHIENNGDNRIV